MDSDEHIIDTHFRFWNILQPDSRLPVAFHKRLHASLKQDFDRNIKAQVWAEAQHSSKRRRTSEIVHGVNGMVISLAGSVKADSFRVGFWSKLYLPRVIPAPSAAASGCFWLVGGIL
jgi:hypothetical protein